MSDMITVYIMTYNRPDYLTQCLESLRGQTYKRFKTVVLDNCSLQNLDAVISEYADMNIEYVKHAQNLLSTGNFAFAWQQVKTTDYFVVFHDDDLMHPRFLELELGILDANPNLVWVASDSISFKGKPPAYPNITGLQPAIFDGSELALGLIQRDMNITFSSVMYRSNTTGRVDLIGLNQSHSIVADRPILFELINEDKCALILQPLILYRSHNKQDSKTGLLNEDNLQELFVSYKKQLITNWTPVTQNIFYSWSGFHIVDGYSRLDHDKKSSFRVYLDKARSKGIYDNRIFYYYLLGLVKHWYHLTQHRLKMLVTDPVGFVLAVSQRLFNLK